MEEYVALPFNLY